MSKNISKRAEKLLSIMLIISIMLSLLPVNAYAAEGDTFTEGGLEYEVLTEDSTAGTGTAVLTGYDSMSGSPTGSLTVTEAVYYDGISYRITGIGDSAFSYSSGITGVTIPASVESIGETAFSQCSNLEAFTVAGGNACFSAEDGVLYDKAKTTLIKYPFGKAFALSSLPGTVKKIGAYAFAYRDDITEVNIPASLEEIDPDAFYGCGNLSAFTVDSGNGSFSAGDGILYDKAQTTLIKYPSGKAFEPSFSFPATVKKIGAYAFAYRDDITDIVIPDSVEAIKEEAFANCTSLESVTIGSSVESIGDKAFAQCISLESVVFEADSSLKAIGEAAFGECFELESLTLPDTLESIGARAFGYTALESINIGASVNTIGKDALYVCTKLTSIVVDQSNSYYMAEEGVLYDKAQTTLIRYPAMKPGSSFSIPASVETIGEGAFYACKNIEAVTIPASVNTIGDAAFYWASVLKEISFLGAVPPSSISDDSTFSNTALTAIYVPAGSVDAYKAALSDYAYKVQAAPPLSATGTMDIGGETGKDLASNQSGTGWAWNAATATLTLIGGTYAGQPIAINCNGNDTINFVYTGNVSISNADADAIFCNGSLTVGGSSGTLALSYTGNGEYGGIASFNSGNLTINSGTVNASSAGTGVCAAAIYANGGVTVSGSANVTVTATGADASGICVGWSGVTISTTGTVTANGSGTGGALAMMNGGKLNMNSGSLALTGTPLKGMRFADILITGGSITIGGTPVYRALLTLSGVNTETAVTTISSPASGYGISSNYTSDDGRLCFLLPIGSQTVTLTAGGKTYTGTVNVSTDNAATATLTVSGGSTEYAVTVNSGTANPATAAANTTVTITANAAPAGQRFKEWTVQSGGVTLANKNAVTTTFTMPESAVEVTATYENIPAGTTPVTGITLNQTSADLYRNTTPNTVTLTATVAPAEATDKTVTWQSSNTAVATVDASGKVTAVGNGTAVITATTTDGGYTASCTVTVITYSSGGNNDGGNKDGGSSGRDGSTAPTAGTTATDGSGTATATASIDGSGNASAAVTQTQISNAIAKALEAAAKSGQPARVEIKVEVPADAKTVEIAIPQASFRELAGGKVESLTINTPAAEITFDAKALSTISEQAAGEVKITTSRVDASTLSAEARQLVGDRPVFDFSVRGGGKEITQFGGTVTVSVPYTPQAGEDVNAIVIYYLNAKGEAEIVTGCRYDAATGKVIFETDHFSRYAVGYNKVEFKDIEEKSPYREAVTFIAARGITGGTGNGNFSPEAALSRGEFLVMLMRAYNIAPDRDISDNFADAGNTWYTGYLAAAKRLGISEGVGANSFAPERKITNQELYTLLYNFLEAMNRLPGADSGKELAAYGDSKDIAPWAEDAMALFAKAGILEGRGGRLNPKDTATRAEMARIMYSLLSK